MSYSASETLPVVDYSRTRLTGLPLTVIRGLWVALALLILLRHSVSMSLVAEDRLFFCEAEQPFPCPGGYLWAEEAGVLQSIGLSPQVHAWYFILVFTVPALVALVGMGLFLAWRRSDDWLVLLISLFLINMPALLTPYLADFEGPGWWYWLELLSAFLFTFGAPLIPMIFPDGRFVPRWIRWLVVPMIGWFIYFAWLPGGPPGWQDALTWTLTFGGVVALLYRYFDVSDQAQKRQIKWVVIVLVLRPLTTFFLGGLIIPAFVPVATTPGIARVIFHMIAGPLLSTMPFVLTALAFGAAITQYRLWDVDFFINRSLVYLALTVGLGIAFAAGFVILRGVLQLALGDEGTILAAIIATGVVVGLFVPVRSWLRRLIDRQVYGIGLDYIEAVRQYEKLEKRVREMASARTHFGSYTDLKPLGRGGMGEVYRAVDTTLDRVVAVKLLPIHLQNDQTARERFTREARAIAGLTHPHIITLYDFGEEAGMPYMILEYIEGHDLSERLRQRGKLALDELLPLLKDAASGLDYAHAQEVIHRDVKPSNVMVRALKAGGPSRREEAVLMDFGIARLLSADATLTRVGGLVGTLDFIAPEQIQAGEAVDGRVDVYALGVTAFQLLTGVLPFRRTNPGAMVMAHLLEPAPDPLLFNPDLPERVGWAIRRALAKAPGDRYPTAGAFVEALEG